MENKVIVAGAGHGGIVAAYYLALAGKNVTVYEKERRENLGHEQSDFIHLDGFEKSGIPIPEEYRRVRIPITFSVLGEDIIPVSQHESENLQNVCIERHALYEYLISLAENAGVKFVFECEVKEPIVLGSRVIGIKTNLGDFTANIVIDACGVDSPVRRNLPDFMNIQKEPGKYEILYSFRGIFNKTVPDASAEYKYRVSLILNEFKGISWIITEDDCVDILIGSFVGITEEDIDRYLEFYRKENDYLGTELIRGGKIVKIPVRQPLGVLVADGYAAVGDSAFMTVPVKGSGIGYSMRAGKMLADCINEDEYMRCSRELLWKYQVNFFEEIGFSACLLATLKNKLPSLNAETVKYAFNEKVVSSEDLTLFGSEAGIAKILSSLSLGKLNDKAKKVIGNPDIRKTLSEMAMWMAKYKITENSFPDKYDSTDIEKWAAAYCDFFESIKPDESSTAPVEERETDLLSSDAANGEKIAEKPKRLKKEKNTENNKSPEKNRRIRKEKHSEEKENTEAEIKTENTEDTVNP